MHVSVKRPVSHIFKVFFFLFLQFIVRESNYNQIVMSKEFEMLDKPLMVEIIRRKQMPQMRSLQEPQFESSGM